MYLEDGADDALPRSLPAEVLIHRLAPGVVATVASTVTSQPILAVARCCDVSLAAVAGSVTFAVIGVQLADPGNLGTILRTAEAAGAGAVVLTEGSVDPFNPKVVRAAAGALGRVPIVVDVALADLGALGLPVLGAVARGGVPYDEVPLSAPVALAFGSEAHGLPAGLALYGLVSIPHVGRSESLNVAMAAAVLCFEVARQRRAPGWPIGGNR